MRALKNVIILVIVVVIFLLIISGVWFAGGNGSWERIGGALTAGISGGVYEAEDGSFIVNGKKQYMFVDKMLAKGWVLKGTRDGVYTFEKDGHIVEYKGEPMWFGFESYELTE